jgi:hypothetical protein
VQMMVMWVMLVTCRVLLTLTRIDIRLLTLTRIDIRLLTLTRIDIRLLATISILANVMPSSL